MEALKEVKVNYEGHKLFLVFVSNEDYAKSFSGGDNVQCDYYKEEGYITVFISYPSVGSQFVCSGKGIVVTDKFLQEKKIIPIS